MPVATDPVAPYRERFERAFPGRLGELRELAMAAFAERGFPTTDDEEWRFTPLSRLRDTVFARPAGALAADVDAAPWSFGGAFATQIVTVNGRYAPGLSRIGALPAGVRVGGLAAELAAAGPALALAGSVARFENRPMTALNTALFEDGAVVWIPRGVVVEDTIHVLHLTDASEGPVAVHPRTLIVAEANSQANIVESYAGTAGALYFTNPVTEIVVEAGAVLKHCRVQRDSTAAYHVADQSLRIAGGGVFASNLVTLGAAIARLDAGALLDGEGIDCTLDGLYIADGSRLVDNHTAIDHAYPHGSSHEVFKGIVTDHGRGVFNGKIMVRLDAQKTDARQTNQTLLLSDDAQINTKPQLEIFADDVRCTHGATVGQLDADALFYLRSRGIPRDAAKAMLVYAFAGAIVERIAAEPVREELRAALLERLGGGDR